MGRAAEGVIREATVTDHVFLTGVTSSKQSEIGSWGGKTTYPLCLQARTHIECLARGAGPQVMEGGDQQRTKPTDLDGEFGG